VGLGDGPSEWDDYEWVKLSDVRASGRTGRDDRGRRIKPRAAPAPPADIEAVKPYAEAMVNWFRRAPLWVEGAGTRVLLVDLDNLRAGPVRWAARMGGVLDLARSADHAAFAGQAGAVDRARPWLAEFADRAVAVGGASDEADWALLDAAAGLADDPVQFVVVSNDHIFARLADRGLLTLLSPGAAALSGRLREAAYRVVDLVGLERDAEAALPAPPA